MKYCNYVIVGEVECCGIWNLEVIRKDGTLHKDNIITAMRKMIECGVKEKVIVHGRETFFLMDVKSGEYVEVEGFDIPKEQIKSYVGGGDNFCAGCLYGIYHNHTNRQILEFASAVVACNLLAAESASSMKSREEIMELMNKYPRITKKTKMTICRGRCPHRPVAFVLF